MKQGRTTREKDLENSLLSTAIQDTFTSECDILRETKLDNFDGTFRQAFAVPSAKHKCVPCALNGRKAKEEELQTGKVTESNYYVLHLPPGTDVTEKDKIKVGRLTFDIQAVSSPVSIEVAVEVDLVLVA
jgi:hypothetical protein